jgi:hypothetical protein
MGTLMKIKKIMFWKRTLISIITWIVPLLMVAQSIDSALCDIVISGISGDVSCKGGTDGKIDVTLSGTEIESVLWSTGIITEDLYQIGAGIYHITVKSKYCSASAEFQVHQPDEVLMVDQTHIILPTCPGYSDASVDLEIKGGTAPYLVYLDSGVSDRGFKNLGAGAYAVKVSDAKGCTAEVQIEIPDIQKQTLTIGEDISIQSGESFEIDAGSGYSNYQWSNGEKTQKLIFSRETDKVYTESLSVAVVDQNGCTINSNLKTITVYPLSSGE